MLRCFFAAARWPLEKLELDGARDLEDAGAIMRKMIGMRVLARTHTHICTYACTYYTHTGLCQFMSAYWLHTHTEGGQSGGWVVIIVE